MPQEEKDDIEKLKARLYSRGRGKRTVSDIRTPLPKSEAEAPVSWAPPVEEEPKKKEAPFAQFEIKRKMSFATKFFIVSVLFFLVAAGAAAYLFLGGGNLISASNIDLQAVAPSLVDGGKEATVQILINNKNTSALTLVDLVVDYPSGTRDPANPTQALSHVRQTIGTVAAGQQLTETASGIFYGQEGEQEQIQVTLEYSVAGSNAVFQKQTTASLVIGSSPVSVSISAPSAVISGQSFPIDITVQSNATTPISNVVVQGQYPFGYSVASANPPANAGGTFWSLGTLAPGSSQVIHLVGSITGQNGDSRVFRFLAGSNTDLTDTTVKVPFLTVPQTITVQQPFISGVIAVNGQSGSAISVVPSGNALQGSIQWQNNLQTAVSNAQFVLTLSGPALDTSSISSNSGFYQSQNSTITWSSAQDPSLVQVPPGGSGTLQFSFSTLPPGAGNVLITNPTITLNLAVQGTTAGTGNVPQQVSSAASAQVSLASSASLTAQALHFTGPIQNSGPMPPTVGQDTSYTIMWTVKNPSNDIANAMVSAVLPPYARYVSAGASGVSYDSGSRTVTWSIGDLPPGVGYSTPAQQANFQVVLTPSSSQVGSEPTLTGDAVLSGQDRFAQVPVNATAPAPTTLLQGDSGFKSGMEIVGQ